MSNLKLNILKTKEMCIDFRKESSVSVTNIKGESIQSVDEYKYLGVVFDHKLRWDKWTETVNKKGQQRLYFLRKMMSFNASISILRVFITLLLKVFLHFVSPVGLEMPQ